VAIGMLVVAAAWLAWIPVASGATLKDSFAARETVKAAPVDATGSTVGAGTEAGEPVPTALSAAGHSLWLKWEAPSSAYYTFATCGSSIPTVLATYSGSELSKLNEDESRAVFGGPDCTGVRNGITMLVLTGGDVQVLVDGNDFFVPPALPPDTEGPVALRIETTPPAVNDDFANATGLAGTTSEEPDGARFHFASAFGYNWNATQQAGEPKHAGDQGGSSVWYSWTAPESGVARVGLCCGTANLLGVYTGGAVGALTPVQAGENSVEVPVMVGTTYRIAVDSEFSFFLGGTFDDDFDLSISMKLAPGTRPGGGGPGPAVDTTPPETRASKFFLMRKPPVFVGFRLRSSEPGSTFRCRFDGRPFRACGSSRGVRGLSRGRHRFEAFAIDASGNADPTPAVAHFKMPNLKPKDTPAKGKGKPQAL
jgi:hypothetical protein